MNIPFTGTDVAGAVLSMNKLLSKQIWLQQQLPTATYFKVTAETNINEVVEKVGLPLIIKPANEGSSIGMSKATNLDELEVAINEARQFDAEVMAESWINGPEYTVAIVDGQALPMIRLKTPHEFYDYEAKYQSNSTEYLCPCGLSAEEESDCKQLAITAFNALGMHGWGRIDLMRDESGQFYLLEANSVPGMTDHSLVPMAAAHAGMSFEQLVLKILQQTVKEAA
jgi:D-alanine-D-alanine ligase